MLISALNVTLHGALVDVARASLHGAVCAMVAVACAPVPVLGGGRFGRVDISRGYYGQPTPPTTNGYNTDIRTTHSHVSGTDAVHGRVTP